MKGRTEEEKIRHLKSYKWSSLPGYIKKRGKQQFVDYSSVLGEYGGDNDKGRRSYKERLFMDISTGSEIKEKIMGQSILGSEEFIDWLWENILKEDRNRRERPALREIQGFKAGDEIIKAVESVTGRSLEEIKKERGYLRYIVMDLLYRGGGIKGVEIGKIMGVDYSTVSHPSQFI
jgi:hypothetical protein